MWAGRCIRFLLFPLGAIDASGCRPCGTTYFTPVTICSVETHTHARVCDSMCALVCGCARVCVSRDQQYKTKPIDPWPCWALKSLHTHTYTHADNTQTQTDRSKGSCLLSLRMTQRIHFNHTGFWRSKCVWEKRLSQTDRNKLCLHSSVVPVLLLLLFPFFNSPCRGSVVFAVTKEVHRQNVSRSSVGGQTARTVCACVVWRGGCSQWEMSGCTVKRVCTTPSNTVGQAR